MKKIIISTLFGILLITNLFLTTEVSAEMVQKGEDSYEYYEELDFVQINLGDSHSIALTSEGRLFTWGYNGFGQLGDGTITNKRIPTEITSKFSLGVGETITEIRLGDYHSSAITSEGRIFTWGLNSSNQLGDGTTTDRSTPTEITSNFNLGVGEIITEVSLGGSHSLAMTSEGRIFAWGSNFFRQLGDGTTTNRSTPTEITSNFNLGLGETFQEVNLGDMHSSAITSEGRIFTWGYNSCGQLGDGTTTYKTTPIEITSNFILGEGETIVEVRLGVYHSSALTSEGKFFTWGSNTFGALGDGTTTSRYTPTEITSNFNLGEGETITKVRLDYYYSSAITSKGRIFTWGYNNNGQLGDGTGLSRYTPTEITSNFNLGEGEAIIEFSLGSSHSSAITSEGRLFTWGYNDYGQIGDGTTKNRYTPTEITNNVAVGKIYLPSNETIQEVSLGDSHSSAITSEGRIYTWGINNYGQLGDGTTTNKSTPTEITSNFNLGVGEIITKVNLRSKYSSAITSEGRIFTWGYNGYGILGDGTTTHKSTPTEITSNFNLGVGETITEVSLGVCHSSAITSERRIFTWGYNKFGQLGDGTTTNKSTPTEITNNFNLGDGETITEVSLGSFHSSAMTSEGRIFTWGWNNNGQLGDGTRTDKRMPREITSNFNLGVDETITEVSLGNSLSSAITSEGRIYTWGSNGYGQLGDGTTTYKSTPTEITSNFNLGVGETITEVNLGVYYSSAITSERRIFTWGINKYGQLGDDTTTNKSTPIEITSNFNLGVGETITEVSLGEYHSSAITSEGRIFTWGYNNCGQLGYGTTTSRNTPTQIYNSIFQVDNIELTYIENEMNGTSNNIKLSIFPEYDIESELSGLIINNIQYDTSKFETSNGRIDVYIPNVWNIGDEVTFTVNAFIYTNEEQLLVSGDTTATTTLVADTFPPSIEYEYPYELYIEQSLGNNDLIAALSNDDNGDTLTVTIVGAVDWETAGEYNITYSATDNSSNTTTQYRKIVVFEDDVSTSGDIYEGMNFYNFDSEVHLESTNLTNQTVTFNSQNYYSSDDYSEYIYSVGWNTFVFSFIVEDRFVIVSKEIFEDTIAPTFDTIVNQAINEDNYLDIDWTTYITNESDNSDGILTKVEVSDNVVYDTPGTYTVTVKVVDESNNQTSQTFNVTVEDTTVPTFDSIADQTIEAGISDIEWTTYIKNASDNTDGILTKVEVFDNVDYDTPGTYTVTVKVVDESNNETSQTFNVTVEDTTVPTFDTINQTIEAGVLDIDWTTYIINESDNSDGTLTIIEVEDNIDYDTPGTYTVTVKVVDESNNKTSKTFNVTVEDTTAPTFDTIEDQTIEAGVSVIEWTILITNESDNSDGILTLIEVTDNVDYDTPGTYTVTVKVIDESLNETSQTFNVTVEDTTVPTFNPIEDQTIEAGVLDIEWTILITNASDNSDDTLTKVEVADNVVFNTPGTYTVTVKVIDESLNETSQTFNVTVEDTTTPTFDTIADQTIEAGVSDIEWTTLIENESDNSDGTLTKVEVTDNVDYNSPGTYTVTVKVVDESNNETSQIFNVTVEDTTAPIIILNPGRDTIHVNEEYTDCGVSINDYSDTITIIEGKVDSTTVGVYELTYRVTDSFENESIIKRYVNVLEKKPTVVFELESSLTTIPLGNAYVDGDCNVYVNGIKQSCNVIENNVDINKAGIYTITYGIEVDGVNYTYKRYIFVFEVGTKLTLYYRKDEESDIL